MPIQLFTGLPGNGKTLLMVEHLFAAAKDASRPVWAAGIDGLQPGLASELKEPTQWNAHDPNGEPTCDCHGDGNLHAHLIPDGSLIYIDEAWKWFGHLQNATRQSTPQHVLALAEHRHRGIDFVWTTQMPVQLYPFARSLVQGHSHVVRRFGTQLIDVYTWQELQEEVKSKPNREMALKKTRMLPKEHFGNYKSATLHTIKRNIPLRVMALPLLLVLGAVFALIAYNSLKPENMAAKYSGAGLGDGLPAPAQAGIGAQVVAQKEQKRFRDSIDYAQQHLPRFPTMPWTAPVYDERQSMADPQLFCMSSNPGPDANGKHIDHTCTCITEQGSYYELGIHECRHVARRGEAYNPYSQRHAQPQQQQPAAAAHYLPSADAPRRSPGVVVGYKPGSRGDVFPRSAGGYSSQKAGLDTL